MHYPARPVLIHINSYHTELSPSSMNHYLHEDFKTSMCKKKPQNLKGDLANFLLLFFFYLKQIRKTHN